MGSQLIVFTFAYKPSECPPGYSEPWLTGHLDENIHFVCPYWMGLVSPILTAQSLTCGADLLWDNLSAFCLSVCLCARTLYESLQVMTLKTTVIFSVMEAHLTSGMKRRFSSFVDRESCVFPE